MGTPWLNPLRWLEWLTNLLGDDTPAGCKPLVPNTRLQLQRLEARLVPALTAVGDTASTALNTAVTIAVEANDTIPPGDTVFLSYFGGVSDGTVAVVGNELVYTPDSGYYGVDHFGYELSDTLGAQSYAGVSVTVGAGSTLLAVADTASTPINTAVTIAAESNDTIPSGDSVSLNVGFGMTSHGTVVVSGSSVVYTPHAGFYGTDTFAYTLADSYGHTTSVTDTVNVTATLLAVADTTSTALNTAVTIAVESNDTIPASDTVTMSMTGSQPPDGSATVVGTSIVYTPHSGFYGVDSFTYILADSYGHTSTAIDTVTVGAGSTLLAVADTASTTALNTNVTIAAESNDTIPAGDTAGMTIGASGQAQYGAASVSGTSIIYTPDIGFFGVDDFTYSLLDIYGHTSIAIDTVTIGAGSTLLAVADTASTALNTAVTLGVKSNDTFPISDSVTVGIGAGSQPANGTATVSGSSVTYTPDAGFYGIDYFTYSLSDAYGHTSTAIDSVTVGAGSTLLAVADTASTALNTAVTMAVKSNDTIPASDAVSISLTQPAYGSVTVSGSSVVFTPAAGDYGPRTFTYTLLGFLRPLFYRHRYGDNRGGFDPAGGCGFHLHAAQHCRHDGGGKQRLHSGERYRQYHSDPACLWLGYRLRLLGRLYARSR